VILVGCAEGKTGSTGVVIRDSAGIQIVEHSSEYEASLPVWTADSVVLDIGAEPGEDLLGVGGAARLADGRIVVINRGTGELRLFDDTGRRTQTIGRLGEGPGEFTRSILSIQLLDGDTLFVIDGGNRRGTWFTSTGAVVKTTMVSSFEEEHSVSATGVVAGRLLVGDRHYRPMRETEGPVRRDSFAIALMQPGGRVLDTIVIVPGAEVHPALGHEAGHEFPTIHSVIFGRTTDFSTNGKHIVVGTNEESGVRVFDASRKLIRFIRTATPPEPVTEELRERRRQENLARLQRTRADERIKADWIRGEADRRFASVLPQHDRVLFGADGSVWMERPRHYDDEGRRFVVYDTTGKAIATVRCPDRMRPYQVGPQEIIGLWRDPDDVEHVRVYRVVRPAQ
jgi:hypothetical protein